MDNSSTGDTALWGPTRPLTGTSSWVLVFAALVCSTVGGLLLRTTRRAA